MILTKHNPKVSIVCAVIMLAVAIFFTVREFLNPLDRMTFATAVLLYVFGTGTLLREFIRSRKQRT